MELDFYENFNCDLKENKLKQTILQKQKGWLHWRGKEKFWHNANKIFP